VTVAAVILAATPGSALADAAGRPSVRRDAESAWAGGALPVIVVAADPDGSVARALAGSAAILAAPAPSEAGPVGQIVRGITVASDSVRETEGALVWPARFSWVDPETVTSLIEAFGPRQQSVLRPAWDGQAGWPVLVPLGLLDSLAGLPADRMPDELWHDLAEAGVPIESIELGDPGVIIDRETPLGSLPAYLGPNDPVGGLAPEWGAAVADAPDEPPLVGPSLAPYPQAADPEASSEG